MNKYTAKLINLPGYVITRQYFNSFRLCFWVKLKAKHAFCPKCSSKSRICYETRTRRIKHNFWAHRQCLLYVLCRKFKCNNCKTRFWEALPGIKRYGRRTEAFKQQIAKDALAGCNNKLVAGKYNLGQATVQRDINHHTDLELRKISARICPRVLGIDEHFFTKRHGYVTTFCDLVRRKIFDIRLGRSEKSLEAYLSKLQHKDRVELVVMDLSTTYRSIITKHFPNARIITDRFHVIRLVNTRFNEVWKQLDAKGRTNQALVSLFRRKPINLDVKQQANLQRYLASKHGLTDLYKLRNKLCRFLNLKEMQYRYARKVIKCLFAWIERLKGSNFKPLISLANTLELWHEEILRMMKYTRSNGITEGFHNKMKRIVRIAYGFRNFKNYRNRVLLQCA